MVSDLLNSTDSPRKRYNLIDYGLCTNYIDKKGNHFDNKRKIQFRGNVVFASANSLNFHNTSRKDDLISLVYLLIYLAQGHLNCFVMPNQPKVIDLMHIVQEKKTLMTLEQLCSTS